MISATIAGKLVSWINSYVGDGPVTIPTTPVAVASDEATVTALAASATVKEPTLQWSSTSSVSIMANAHSHSHRWIRQAYYNAAAGISDGFTFLNHYGGSDGIPGTAAGGAS